MTPIIIDAAFNPILQQIKTIYQLLLSDFANPVLKSSKGRDLDE